MLRLLIKTTLTLILLGTFLFAGGMFAALGLPDYRELLYPIIFWSAVALGALCGLLMLLLGLEPEPKPPGEDDDAEAPTDEDSSEEPLEETAA